MRSPRSPSSPDRASDPLARLRMLSDTPLDSTERDYFGFATYANALSRLIDSEGTDTPLTLAISGRWGSGKTSLARLVEKRLLELTAARAGERPNLTCWFDAWMHNDAPHLGTTLASVVARVAGEKRPFWRRIIDPLPAAMLSPPERWRRRALLMFGAVVLAIVVLLIPGVQDALSGSAEKKVIAGGSFFVLLFALGEILRLMRPALQHAAQFLADPKAGAAAGTVEDARNELGRLIAHAARKGRIVVFIDNLERCSPARAVEVCEVTNQLLSHPGVVTVFVADMQLIESFAGKRYSETGDPERAGRDYLEKIVQIELPLPPPRDEDMERLLRWRAPAGSQPRDVAEPSKEAVPQGVGWVLLGNTGEAIRARPALALVGIVAGVAVAYAVWSALDGGTDPFIVGIQAVLLGLNGFLISIGLSASILDFRARRRARAARERVKAEIQKVLRSTDQDKLEEKVVGEVDEKDRALAHEVVKEFLVGNSHELVMVEEVIFGYPPALPRSAKRMLNHARLLTQIARDRELFGGNPPLTAEALGEWIVLKEKWPSLARLIEEDPKVLGRLEEQAARQDGQPPPYTFSMNGTTLDLKEPDRLQTLLSTPPTLGGVAERLVHFEPAPKQAPPA